MYCHDLKVMSSSFPFASVVKKSLREINGCLFQCNETKQIHQKGLRVEVMYHCLSLLSQITVLRYGVALVNECGLKQWYIMY